MISGDFGISLVILGEQGGSWVVIGNFGLKTLSNVMYHFRTDKHIYTYVLTN